MYLCTAMSLELNRITIDKAVCNGKPTIRGKRITVQTILEFLGAGDSVEDVLKSYPMLEVKDIEACLQFAASMMSHEYTYREIA